MGAQPGYGAPPGAMVPMGGAPMVGGPGGGAGGPPGTIRNAVMIAAISYLCCPFYGVWQLYQIEGELKAYLGKGGGPSVLWFIFGLIPLLSMPKLVGEARARAGTSTQGDGNLIMYLLLGIFIIPNDVNEIWTKLGVQPK
jgi:hypothetical protein